MNRRRASLTAAIVAATLSSAAGLAGQIAPHPMGPRAPVRLPAALPTSLAARCAGGGAADPVVERVAEALARPEPSALRAVADSLEAELAPRVRARNEGTPDPELLHRWALAQGVRVEALEGRDRLRAAEELHRRALRVLEVEPDHPGAHHLLGRLTAGVLRLGGATRLLARLMVGGELLSSASWPLAQDHLARAERGAPCVPEHHVELARALLASGDPRAAREEAAHALSLAPLAGPRASEVRRRAVALLEESNPRP